MTAPHLSLVGSPPGYESMSRADKLKWLKAALAELEAESLTQVYEAAEHLTSLLEAVASRKPSDGITDLARRLVEDIQTKTQTMQALEARR